MDNKTLNFIQKAKEIHKGKYSYDKVVYKNNKDKVIIICPIHGDFKQSPVKHLTGQGCPMCAKNRKHTRESFIEAAHKVHGDEFDYSKVKYTNENTKVIVICRNHGEFLVTPKNHLKGRGCPICHKERQKTGDLSRKWSTEKFIEEARKIHGNEYDYSKVVITAINKNVTIICPEHGEFEQQGYIHLKGAGCPKCASIIGGLKRRKNCAETFIEKAQKIHGDKYDYSQTDYTKAHEDVIIICHGKYKDGKEHGPFRQKAYHHLNGCGCPICGTMISQAENNIIDFIKSIYSGEVITNSRSLLPSGRELDIYLPEFKIGIEYNGMIWHSSKFRDKNYHLDKLNECNKVGIQLIQIFENEYVNHRDIVEAKIKHILHISNTEETIQGRKCKIQVIERGLTNDFLDANHIQGKAGATVRLGAFHNGELIGVMTFLKKDNENNWELNRFATLIKYNCIGIGGKLFKHFIRNYDYTTIKSFADRRWTLNENNNLYTKLGFELNDILPPEYRYTRAGEFIHKFNFRKDRLHKKYNLPLTMTEIEMARELGFYRIYDCGLLKYVYTDKQ